MILELTASCLVLAVLHPGGVPSDEESWDGFAYDITAAPDLDGDGMEDLLIGDPDPQGSESARGGVWIVSGEDGALIRRVQAEPGDGWFGVSVAWLGVREQGGPACMAVGVATAHPDNSLAEHRNWLTPGSVRVVQVDGQQLSRTGDIAAPEEFGRFIRSVPDLDGDGLRDLLLVAGGRLESRGRVGTIHVLSAADLDEILAGGCAARSGRFESNALITESAAPEVGRLLAAVVRSPGIKPKRSVNLYRTEPELRLVRSFAGLEFEHDFGHCVADLGDLDGDGWPEIAVGVPVFVHGQVAPPLEDERGAVRIFSSRTGSLLRELLCPDPRYLFGAAIAVRAPAAGEDAPVLLVTSASRVESSASGNVAELFEFSTRTWKLLRTRDLAENGGQRLLVLRGADGAQRVVTSRCDCDAAGFPGAVSILSDDPHVEPAAKPIVLTRATLLAARDR